MAIGRDISYRALFERNRRVIKAKVLMVGAGGIGCELLKNLVLTGFTEIHIVDLDTIDLSNLNRQFLFGHEHIKQSKAKVAKESAEKFNHKDVEIVAYHGNIKDAQFDVEFFESFTMVFNALDNVDARRYVNKMIIAADVPMVDCGTTGFHGHTQVIKKGITPCYDCTPKATPTSFPVCTIRSTPSQPIHCIVWAKSYLFSEIFGVTEEDVPELDFTEDSVNAEEIKKLREEATALQKIRENSRSESFARVIFDKVFKDDVERLLSMAEMWVSRKPPQPLSWDTLRSQMIKAGVTGNQTARKHQSVWTPVESFAVFLDSTKRLQQRINADNRPDGETVLSFDKDDMDTMDFVAASANLRSHIFGIETKSRWDIKQMAGNIIPAIATTNAMFAALAVIESYKVLRALRGLAPWNDAPVVYDNSTMHDRAIAKQTAVDAPNPRCHVCSVARHVLRTNPASATVQHLVDALTATWDYDADEMTIYSGSAEVIYDPDMPDNLDRKLADLGITRGAFIEVEDLSDSPKVNHVLNVRLPSSSIEPPCVIENPQPLAAKPPPPPPAPLEDGDEVPLKSPQRVVPIPVFGDTLGKRKRPAADEGEIDVASLKISKKAKPAEDGGDVVVIEEDNDGFITID